MATEISRVQTQVPALNLLLLVMQPLTLELMDIGHRYAAMEAEIAWFHQQSTELQGKPFLFLLFAPLIKLPPYRVLLVESIAKVRREKDDASL